MNEENNKSKKKILTYYLILGACILLIAAITITVIFAVKNAKTDLTLDPIDDPTISGDGNQTGGDNTNNDNNPDDTADNNTDDKTDDNSTTVSGKLTFIAPIGDIDIINSYTFYKNNTLDCYYFHTGLDLSGEEGTPVFASLDGTVESITTGDILDGTVITLSHDNGLKTVYMFVDADENLAVGDKVKQGDVIGTISSATGKEYKDGAHLHYEVYLNNVQVDPETYIDGSLK
jgi:murein DD-endopeptidase MepM/ murein hydrolase activator NlpD